jgi:hypothetical protein
MSELLPDAEDTRRGWNIKNHYFMSFITAAVMSYIANLLLTLKIFQTT